MSNPEIIRHLPNTNTVVKEDGTVRISTPLVFCIEGQSAWWVEDKQKCAVAAIGGERHGKR